MAAIKASSSRICLYFITRTILCGKEFVVGPAEDGGLLVGYEALKNMYLGVQVSEQMSINFTRKLGRSDISVQLTLAALTLMLHCLTLNAQWS